MENQRYEKCWKRRCHHAAFCRGIMAGYHGTVHQPLELFKCHLERCPGGQPGQCGSGLQGGMRQMAVFLYGVHCNTPNMPILIENDEKIMINQWGERSGLDKKICLSLLVTFCRNPRPLTLKVEAFDSI